MAAQPAANSNWAIEISLDVEWAHAIAPKATIVLVEAPSNSLGDLLAGVQTANRNGASVVSMSWTVGEFSSETSLDNYFASNSVSFVAASGDAGTGVAYPAASPYVIGVGGTSLALDANGNYLSETAWSGSGGGISAVEHEPLYPGAIRDSGRFARAPRRAGRFVQCESRHGLRDLRFRRNQRRDGMVPGGRNERWDAAMGGPDRDREFVARGTAQSESLEHEH